MLPEVEKIFQYQSRGFNSVILKSQSLPLGQINSLAKLSNCEKKEESCQCSICEKVDRGVFPGLIKFDFAISEGRTDRIRELIGLSSKRWPDVKKLNLVCLNFDLLDSKAQDILLKFVEEGASDCAVFFVVRELERVNETIVSRCPIFDLILGVRVREEILDELGSILEKGNLEDSLEEIDGLIKKLETLSYDEKLALLNELSTHKLAKTPMTREWVDFAKAVRYWRKKLRFENKMDKAQFKKWLFAEILGLVEQR